MKQKIALKTGLAYIEQLHARNLLAVGTPFFNSKTNWQHIHLLLTLLKKSLPSCS